MNSRERRNSIIKHLDFIILDLLILELSYVLASLIYRNNLNAAKIMSYEFFQQSIILGICYLFTILVRKPYSKILRRNKWIELGEVVKQTAFLLILDILALFFLHEAWWMSRVGIVLTFSLNLVLCFIERAIWKRVLRHVILHSNRAKLDSMIIVCSKNRAASTIANLRSDVYAPFLLKGIFLIDYEENDQDTTISGVNVLGSADDVIEYATHHWVDDVLLNLRHHPKLAENLEAHFEGMGITTHHVVVRLSDYTDKTAPRVEKMGNYIVSTYVLRDVPMIQWILKRILDIVGALVGLLITGIVYLFIAPRIKAADPGPVFYSSYRVGKNGRMFKMYKFRSMYQDADARKAELMSQNKMKGFMFKMDDDPRIIGSEKKDKNGKPKGIGNFIRKTSLDEFPQFLNVLKGDMSLVGTRPPTTDEWMQYSEQHRIRLSMRPGITGMWQVSGRSDITDFEEVVRLDEEYIETWTVAKDLKILFMTVFQVLQHKGAE